MNRYNTGFLKCGQMERSQEGKWVLHKDVQELESFVGSQYRKITELEVKLQLYRVEVYHLSHNQKKCSSRTLIITTVLSVVAILAYYVGKYSGAHYGV